MDKPLKNNGKGTFFGNLLRGIVKTGKVVGEPLLQVVAKATGLGDVPFIKDAILKDNTLSEIEKELLFKELEQDITEMQEVTKRWQSDMQSDSWLSKNIRPLSLAFLTFSLFLYIILDSANLNFDIKAQWIDLLASLLMLVYGGYFGARALEKITKMRQNGQ